MNLENLTVVQVWVTRYCTWKEQTVLFCALRGPDAGGSPEIKAWVRFIRRVVLHNAAPKKTFMRVEVPERLAVIAERSPLVFDMLPVHYLGHLMHALQVIGYRVPSNTDEIQQTAVQAYYDLCDYLHVRPESRFEMDQRLADEREEETA